METPTNTQVPASTPSNTSGQGSRPPRTGGRNFGGKPGSGPRPGRTGRGGNSRAERPKSEFDHKVVDVRRVTRVVSGGRRFSFSVTLVLGDRKGRVGVGLGKAGDTSLAIDKATRDAKKNMITVNMTKTGSIAREVEAKFGSSRLIIRPAPGRGLVAGSSLRTVLSLAGVHDVTSKIYSRTKNKLNNARAAVEALRQVSKI